MSTPQTEADGIIPGPCPWPPIDTDPPIVLAIAAAIEDRVQLATAYFVETHGDVPRQLRVGREGPMVFVTIEPQP